MDPPIPPPNPNIPYPKAQNSPKAVDTWFLDPKALNKRALRVYSTAGRQGAAPLLFLAHLCESYAPPLWAPILESLFIHNTTIHHLQNSGPQFRSF